MAFGAVKCLNTLVKKIGNSSFSILKNDLAAEALSKPKCLEFLLNTGANPNHMITDSDGDTEPLLHATVKRYTPSKECLRLLVNHGANPFLRDSHGQTVLDIACSYDNIHLLCSEVNVNVNEQDDSHKNTPLINLTRSMKKIVIDCCDLVSAMEIADDVITNAADFDEVDDDGMAAMDIDASEDESIAMPVLHRLENTRSHSAFLIDQSLSSCMKNICLLLFHGADASIENNNGQTALAIASFAHQVFLGCESMRTQYLNHKKFRKIVNLLESGRNSTCYKKWYKKNAKELLKMEPPLMTLLKLRECDLTRKHRK